MVKFARIQLEPCENLASPETPKGTNAKPDLFGVSLVQVINLDHPLVGLASEFDWNEPWGCPPLPSRAGKRQVATEPTIGNREWDPRLAWSFLRFKSGDSINCPDEWGWLQHLEPAEGFWLLCVFSSQVVPEYLEKASLD